MVHRLHLDKETLLMQDIFPCPKRILQQVSVRYLSSLLMTRTIPYRSLFLDLNTLVSIAYSGEASNLPKEYAEPWVCKYQITNVDCFLFRIIHWFPFFFCRTIAMIILLLSHLGCPTLEILVYWLSLVEISRDFLQPTLTPFLHRWHRNSGWGRIWRIFCQQGSRC